MPEKLDTTLQNLPFLHQHTGSPEMLVCIYSCEDSTIIILHSFPFIKKYYQIKWITELQHNKIMGISYQQFCPKQFLHQESSNSAVHRQVLCWPDISEEVTPAVLSYHRSATHGVMVIVRTTSSTTNIPDIHPYFCGSA